MPASRWCFTLPPFDEDEARAFLAEEYPGVQVHALLRHLRNRELAHVCRNPLVLRLFAEAARGGGGLPGTRAELLERASRAMAGQDRGLQVVRLVRRDEEELLLASGAICATMLLCDLAGVHDRVPGETPAGFLNVADIEDLPAGGGGGPRRWRRACSGPTARAASRTSTASSPSISGRDGLRAVSRRVFRTSGSIPCSAGAFRRLLRGMQAWLARLGPGLAERCIAADPWAVLRDGETGTLDLDRARALLAALKERSGEDPCFDTEDRGPHPAAGLMRGELKDDIVGILASPGPHAHLSACLAEAMAGTELSVEAGWTLEGILFDPSRANGERAMAFRSLWLAGIWNGEAAALRLLDMGGAVSARLACEAVVAACGEHVPARPTSPAGRGKLRLVAGGGTAPRERPAGVSGDGLFASLDGAALATVLDGLALGAPAAMGEADAWERAAFSDAMRRLAARVLEDDAAVAPERVWSWIGWTREADGEGEAVRERLAAVFRDEGALRARPSGAGAAHAPRGRCPDGLPGTGGDGPWAGSRRGRPRGRSGGAGQTLGRRRGGPGAARGTAGAPPFRPRRRGHGARVGAADRDAGGGRRKAGAARRLRGHGFRTADPFADRWPARPTRSPPGMSACWRRRRPCISAGRACSTSPLFGTLPWRRRNVCGRFWGTS